MVGHIPNIDTAVAMLTWEAQLSTLGNICAKCEQNPTNSYIEIHRAKLFVYMRCFITDIDTALVMKFTGEPFSLKRTGLWLYG